MTVLYLDHYEGNDNYAGTSTTLLASGTDGSIVASTNTFTSASANFPLDGSLINQYLSIFTGSAYVWFKITSVNSSTSLTLTTIGSGLSNQSNRQYYIGGKIKNFSTLSTTKFLAGDELRVRESRPPTSLGVNGTWVSGVRAGLSISNVTATTPIQVTVTVHGLTTGDTVYITGAGASANGTWEVTVVSSSTFTLNGSVGSVTASSGTVYKINPLRVKLSAPVTRSIASTGQRTNPWTPATADITTSLSTSSVREHSVNDSIVVGSAFTTGKVAYYTLPSTLDLSAFRQISFWIRLNLTSSSTWGQIHLCSDSVGDVPVNIFALNTQSLSNTNIPLTLDYGASLGSNINSIALYTTSDISTTVSVTIQLNNIIACKGPDEPDCLTLNSLISKNTANEQWWPIQSINDTRIVLDAGVNISPASSPGYFGVSETVPLYVRQPIVVGTSTIVQSGVAGTTSSRISIKGGWSGSAMAAQTSETWLDVLGANNVWGFATSASYFDVEKFGVIRGQYYNFGAGNSNNNINFVAIVGASSSSNAGAIWLTGQYMNVSVGYINSCAGAALTIDAAFSKGTIRDSIVSCGTGVYVSNGAFESGIASGENLNVRIINCTTAIDGVGSGTVKNFIIDSSCSVGYRAGSQGNVYLKNILFENTNPTAFGTNYGSFARFERYNQVQGDNRIFTGQVVISTDSVIRKTESGVSWKIQPISTVRDSSKPGILKLAKVACVANAQVTVKAWMRRSSTTLNMNLKCQGGQINGVENDVVSSITAAANTWEEVQILFTPTENGVVQIIAEAYGGSTLSGWVDDLTIIQA